MNTGTKEPNTKRSKATVQKSGRRALDAGADEIRKAKREATLLEDVKTGRAPLSSWRDFYKVHPACEVFPASSRDDLRKLAADIDQNGLKVPIQTRHVAGRNGSATFVIDGCSRLDEMEALGWRIVDEKGNWCGALSGKVEHKVGRTHEQIVAEVISFNIRRRHLTKKQQVELIDKALRASIKLEVTPDGVSKHERKKELANMARSFSPMPGKRGGSTKDEHKAAVLEQAVQAGISKRTTERALAKAEPTKPRKVKPKKERSFEDQVWLRLTQLFRRWPLDWQRKVKQTIVASLVGHYDAKTNTFIQPTLFYPNGRKIAVADLFVKVIP